MHSPTESEKVQWPRASIRTCLFALLIGAATMSVYPIAQAPDVPKGTSPDARAITVALERVRKDPNLNNVRKVRFLRLKDQRTTSRPPGWLRWLLDLVGWIAQSARALVWVAAAILAALLAVYISRIVRSRAGGSSSERFLTPTHVQDLDIRPESLPDDIGAAARALWDRGERRAALALLYRGLLSRLAHVHRVPIRDSTTEGSCLVLAATHLNEERHEYVSRLVRVWQRSVYGGYDADTSAVYALCTGFRPALDQAAQSPDGSLEARA